MSDAAKALGNIRIFEELATRNTFLHRRHPLVHVLITLALVITTASFGKYSLSAMLPLLLYPVLICLLGELPFRPILMRMLPVLPLVGLVGILNPWLDPSRISLGAWSISAGWISLLCLLVKCMISVTAALIMVCLIGMEGLGAALTMLRIPPLIVTLLLFTYRYIHLLAEEAGRMVLAYRLRAPGQRGIHPRQWGPMLGQWLLRTLHRAQRIHQAMLCRGFSGTMPHMRTRRLRSADIVYGLGWIGFFVLVRTVHLPNFMGTFILSLIR